VRAKGAFNINRWDERTLEQISENTKTTKASVGGLITGEIEASSSVEYLMYYKDSSPGDPHKAMAIYVGLMTITGSLNGKNGSFVVEDHGTFENSTASSILLIIPGSGMGDLKKIRGTGKYTAGIDGAFIEFEYQI
jgi:hypothetical protein